MMAATGTIQEVCPVFESQEALCQAGVLFAIPALISQGLLKFKDVYESLPRGYYGFESIVLTFAVMALCRIKNPEQLKQCKVGELGRIIGLDRLPETKNLHTKLKQIGSQEKAKDFNTILLNQWLGEDQNTVFYIDGHQRIYFGDKATLTSKHISRQKLCMAATTEYWVNDGAGLPYLVVTGELSETLREMIEMQIIPQLLQTDFIQKRQEANEEILFTLVFDREVYEPAFFHRLLEKKIAIITYRKNVKDRWDENLFEGFVVDVIGNPVLMQLCEQNVTLGGYPFREVRRLNENGHQTSIITTHPKITIQIIAGEMFSRWSQENFFRYARSDYYLDAISEFGIETIDENKSVVNPPYRVLSHRIKKQKEKIGRLKAKLHPIVEEVNNSNIDYLPKLTSKQEEQMLSIEMLQTELNQLITERSLFPARINLKDMSPEKRYNKLKTESKLFMNVIKMICYRAETALAELIVPHFAKSKTEKRMLIKQIFKSPADLIVNNEDKTLTISLYSLSTDRANFAAEQLCQILNQTETCFPGTSLILKYKTTGMQNTKGLEV
jgi:hypothetical protein